jgi:hypothetical protein
MNFDWTQYFYLLGGVVLCVPLWLFVYFNNYKSERRKIIHFSILFGIASIVLEHFFSVYDYWHPVFILGDSIIRVESFIYGFFFGGAVSGIIPLIYKQKEIGKPRKNLRLEIGIIVIIALLFLIMTVVLKINSMIPMIISPLVVGVISLVKLRKRDSIVKHVINGIVALLITVLFYYLLIIFVQPDLFNEYFYLENLSGFWLLGLPLEEALFAFALGFGVTSIYELMFDTRQVRVGKRKKL